MRWSDPIPSTTAATSAPTASHIAATALTKLIFMARKPLAAYLIVSADAGSVIRIGVSIVAYSSATRSAAPRSALPITTRSGWRKSCTAVPSRRNSGFDTTWTSSRSQHPFDGEGRADRHRRLVDHDGARLQHRCDLRSGSLLDVAEVGAAVVALRRGDAQEHDVGTVSGGFGAEHELEPAGGAGIVDDGLEALFDDRDVAVVEEIDLALVDVAAHHVVSEVCEAGARGQADVAGSDDAEANGLRHPVEAIGRALALRTTSFQGWFKITGSGSLGIACGRRSRWVPSLSWMQTW